MAKDGNGEHDNGARQDHCKSKFELEPDPDSDTDSDADEGVVPGRKRRTKYKKSKGKNKSKSPKRRRSRDRDSYSSSSEYDDSSSDSEHSEDSEEEERQRRRKGRKRREEKREKRRRDKEKDKKRKRKEEKRKRKKEKEKGKTGAVTSSWGKYGIIRETDLWNKRPEFTVWLAEVKQVNLESLPNWEEKQLFKDFMEDHNTATFPSKNSRYYNLDAYYQRKMEKEMKKGFSKVTKSERTVFNDEERRQEQLQEREKIQGTAGGRIEAIHAEWNGSSNERASPTQGRDGIPIQAW